VNWLNLEVACLDSKDNTKGQSSDSQANTSHSGQASSIPWGRHIRAWAWKTTCI